MLPRSGEQRRYRTRRRLCNHRWRPCHCCSCCVPLHRVPLHRVALHRSALLLCTHSNGWSIGCFDQGLVMHGRLAGARGMMPSSRLVWCLLVNGTTPGGCRSTPMSACPSIELLGFVPTDLFQELTLRYLPQEAFVTPPEQLYKYCPSILIGGMSQPSPPTSSPAPC